MVLTPFPPRVDAAHGGARVMAQFLSRMARRHSVGILSLRGERELPVDPVLYRECAWVEEILCPHPPTTNSSNPFSNLQVWGAVLSGRPLWVNDCFVPAYAERAKALAQTWCPEVVQAEFHVMGQYLEFLRPSSAATILVEHEPGFSTAHERYKYQLNRGRLLPHLDVLAWKRYERACLEAVDATVVFTERDHHLLAALSDKVQITTIPLGADFSKRALDPSGASPPSLLFVGNFNHPPNVDAAMHLAQTIFPRLRSHHPELDLYLVGDSPPTALKELTDDRIAVTGYVTDVMPYLDRATVVVLPLRYGGGMRVKAIEAFAAGKAVVASIRAVEGLGVRDGEQYLLADDEKEMVRAISKLLAKPDTRIQLAGAARAWAVAHLDWDHSVRAYEALYEQILD